MENKFTMKYETSFLLSDEIRIAIEADELLENIDCCYDASIYLYVKEKKYILAETPLYYAMQVFRDRLEAALNEELLLHESITDNIGYLFNEYSHNDLKSNSSFVLEKSTKKDSWVGYRYAIWSVCANESGSATWLYNDNNNIILEVTALYTWQDPEEAQNYVSYEEWIKDYRSYFKIEIPREIAYKWAKQANSIVLQINLTIERLKKEYNEEKRLERLRVES